MKRQSRRTKTLTIATIAALVFSAQSIQASAVNSKSITSASSEVIVTALSPIVSQFESYLKQGQLPKAFTYLKTYILDVKRSEATVMVLHLENAVKTLLPTMQKRFEAASLQKGIGQVYKKGYSFDNVISRTKEQSLKALLISARDSGFQLETAEGFYFPDVNYTKFKAYADWVNSDISNYIDIMSIESEHASLKDAAIVIGYQQLVNRALYQEKFLEKFPHSNRAAQVKNLFHSYRMLTFYGVNNTPLFGYDNKTMQSNAKRAYTAMLLWNDPESSEYLSLLQEFMQIVEDNHYALTAEVEKFRADQVPND